MWKLAGESFREAGKLNLSICKSEYVSASNYVKAGEMFMKYDVSLALQCYVIAVKLFLDMGQFDSAGKNELIIAEITETNGQLNDAIESYKKVCHYYELANSKNSSMNILLKCTHLLIDSGKHEEAGKNFEILAEYYMTTPLATYKYVEHVFNTCLCKLYLGDIVDTKKLLQKYYDKQRLFGISKEYIFLSTIIDVCANNDITKFTDLVTNYDLNMKLKEWQLKLFDEIENRMCLEEEPDLT
jgi:alpha-soluble NSF attachment protein